MGFAMPKQFTELSGLPLIMHAVKAFYDHSPDIIITLVLPEDGMDEWERIIKRYPLKVDYRICAGGKTRFDSVKQGLEMVDGEGLVAIHDAARPLVSVSLIGRCFHAALEKGNAVPVVGLADSVREIMEDGSRPSDRERFRLVQTPQVFDVAVIRKAYEQAYCASFTDDATVAEAFGVKINLVEGEKRNIKITTPDDLIVANAYLEA